MEIIDAKAATAKKLLYAQVYLVIKDKISDDEKYSKKKSLMS